MAPVPRAIVLFTVYLAIGVNAQDKQVLVLRASKLLDIKTGTLVRNATVIVRNGKIDAVGSALAPPAGAVLLDLGDTTLLPGLLDCHSHLLASSANEYGRMLLEKSHAFRALEGAANAKRTLLAGFTTVRDVENEGSGYADVALRDAIKQDLVPGPRMQVATRGIAAVGQYHPFHVSTDVRDFPSGAQMISGAEEARRAVREQIGNGADLIKVYADWNHPTLTPEELRTIVEEAHKAKRRVAAHATTIEAIRNAVLAGVDSIEHGDLADRETLQLMKERGTWLVPTYGALLAHVEGIEDAEQRRQMTAFAEEKAAMLRMAREIGVRIALGYDAAEAKLQGTNARELAALRSVGFTNLEVIRAATTSCAELMGLTDRVGALEGGKTADIIAVRGDVLADAAPLQDVVFVMKAGVVVRNEAVTSR